MLKIRSAKIWEACVHIHVFGNLVSANAQCLKLLLIMHATTHWMWCVYVGEEVSSVTELLRRKGRYM